MNSVAVNTIGETVTSAEQLVTIVPYNKPVEMVCYVKNMDIADIEIGMEAEIKFEAYPYNKYGTRTPKANTMETAILYSEDTSTKAFHSM